MNIKFKLATVLYSIALTSASAADLPSRTAPAVYSPPFSWTGLYIGGNAGYAFDDRTSYALAGTGAFVKEAIAAGTRPSFFRTSDSGFTGGGQIGYNVQLVPQLSPSAGGLSGGVLAGIEADAAYTDLRGTGDFLGPLRIRDTSFASQLDFLGTVRGRLGLTFGQFLVFGTGGFAYGGVRDDLNFYSAGIDGFTGASHSMRTGYAAGGGVEYAISAGSLVNVLHASAVTLKVEYLHYDLGRSTLVTASLFNAPGHYVASLQHDGDLVRCGINYKFDFGGAPASVVARY